MKNWIICILSLALVTGCSKSESIQIAGSSTVLPIASKAAERFAEQHSGIKLIVNAGGSGVGINQLAEGKVDIGMASRDITSDEIDRYPNVEFITYTVGFDAVVPVVSSEIHDAGVRALTLEQIGSIYKGDVDNWQSFGGPDRKILCVDKEKSRGTRHVFMEKVLGDQSADAPGADLVLGSNNEEQTAIVQSDAAIGMLSNAWLNDDVKGLSIIMADGSIVEPTLDNVLSRRFPLTRALFLITNGVPRGHAKTFIDFVLSPEGQGIVEEVGYVRAVQ